MPPSYTASRTVLIVLVVAVLVTGVLLLVPDLVLLWERLVAEARTLTA